MSYLGGRTIYVDSDGNEHFDYERDYEPKPITNYDRIISMKPEELARLLASNADCNECRIYSYKDGCMENYDTCVCQWLDWLRQEA